MKVLGLLTLLGLLMVGSFASSPPAHAAPADTVVAPRVAGSGADVSVEGAGCTSAVRVTVTRYLWPGTPTVVEDITFAPDADGGWQTVFAMPAEPAYVIAECDGVAAVPIVIAPSDVAYVGSASIEVTPAELALSATGLVGGSEFSIFDLSGTALGSTTVSGDSAEVRIPRSLGAQSVLGLSLSLPGNTGLPDPFIPLVWEYMLPLTADTTIGVAPRVSAAGASVRAAGTCAGTPQVTVIGRTLGWYDVATVFVDVTLAAAADHSWNVEFPMPPIAATVAVTCTDGSASGQASSVIAASTGGVELAVPVPDPDSSIIRIERPEQSTGPYEAFTSMGDPIVLTEDDGVIEFDVPLRPVRVVILGTVLFGENAEALQNQSVQAWFFDVAATQTTPTPTTAPPTTVPSPPTTTTSPPTSDADPGGAPTLPATGFAVDWMVVVGAAFSLGGLVALVGGRRRRT